MSPTQRYLVQTLQAIFYRIRLGAMDFRYDSVRVRGFNVLLDRPVSGDIRPGEVLRASLEIRSIVGDEIREAILLHDAGMEALVFLYPFVSAFLAGMPPSFGPARIVHALTRNVLGRPYCSIDRIEEVSVTVRDPNLCMIDTTVSDPEEPFEKLHYLYKVTWHDGDAVAIDVTGAQFGYCHPVCHWADIEHERGWTVNDVFPLGYVRETIYTDYANGLDGYSVSRRLVTLELAKYIEDNTLPSTKELNKKAEKDELLDQLELCVDMAMDELYTPERIRERVREIEVKLARVDVDTKESVQDFMAFVKKGLGKKGR